MPTRELNVQQYLCSGKSLEDLTNELGIRTTLHPELPLVILNYDQIESPKTHPIVRECRALTLNSTDWSVVARSFPRFFNWGEVHEEMSFFDFSDFIVQSKEDGSLSLLYWFDGHWRVNTRGSFANDDMQFQTFSWREGICRAIGVADLDELDSSLDRNISYVCEFVSPWNKVVRRYEKPQMFLLTAFRGLDEIPHAEVDGMAEPFFVRPQKYEFSSIEQIQKFLQDQAESDPTYEGVVICDKNGLRYKVKSATYLGLHKIRGEGDNLFNPKHLLPFVLNGEDDELLTYYEEARVTYYELKIRVLNDYITLLETWADHKDIEDQKEFALAVKNHPFSGLLFHIRKELGEEQTSKDLRQLWRSSEKVILKRLKA